MSDPFDSGDGETSCDRCGAAVPADNRFCGRCGSPVVGSDGQVRVITVLFADMVGSVERTASVDPERATELVATVIDAMSEAVLAHGGSIDRLLGDGMLALFGAEQASEDAAERAVRAGAQIVQKVVEIGQAATVGINTGSAYLGPVGSSGHVEHTAMGATVNLAARLRAAAAPSEVLVGPATRAATRGVVDYRPRQVSVKGLGDLEAFALAELREGHRRLRGFEGRAAEIVGRTEERAVLARSLADLERGRGGAVFVEGEPGLGKTRLVEELATRADARGVRTVVARCVESGGAPYALWVDVVRQLRAAGPSAAIDLPEIRYLLGEASEAERLDIESLEPDARRARLLDGLHTFWSLAAFERATLLVLEDLHWSDRLSLDVAELVLSLVVDRSLTLVATFRPELDHPCRMLIGTIDRTAPDRTHRIALEELDERETLQLVARLLDRSDAAEIAASLAVDRAQGNPLFVEELVAAAVEDGRLRHRGDGWAVVDRADLAPAEASIPVTLETIVLSRVDNLGPAERRLLRTASVLGRTFEIGEVMSMLEDGSDHRRSLDVLEHRSLIFRADRDRVDGRWYSFKHALVRDTVYASLLRRRREELHMAAARVIEGRTTDLDAAAERLAHHWDAGSDDVEAIAALARAARTSHQAFRLDAALDYIERAFRRAGTSGIAGPVALELEERRGDLLELSGSHEASRASYAAAMVAAGDDSMARARLLRKVGGALTLERSYEPAVSMYRDAARLLDARDDRDQAWWHERLQVVVDEILLNYWRNDTSRMAALDAAFASEVSAHGSDRQRIDYLTGRMMTRLRTSRYAISGNILEASQEIIDLAADDPDPAHHAFVVFNHGFCHLWRRELPEARRRFHEARRLAERGGDATVMLRCETYLAVAERFAGEIGRCRDHALAAQALAATTGMVEYDGAAKGNLAWIARREGRPDDARALALGAIEDWAPLPLVYGFTWLARMPLLAVHGTNGAFELAAAQAAAMVEPSAQRLHDPMPDLLVKAAVGERSATIDLVDAAEPLGYC